MFGDGYVCLRCGNYEPVGVVPHDPPQPGFPRKTDRRAGVAGYPIRPNRSELQPTLLERWSKLHSIDPAALRRDLDQGTDNSL